MSDKTQEFIEKAKLIHGDKYDYSKVEYVNTCTKVIIVCKEHGDFSQTPSNHLMGKGCIKCSYKNASLRNLSTTTEFVKKSQIKHSNKYDYSKVEYVDNKTKVIITCKEHGDFEQKPAEHLSGCGCQTCGKINSHLAQTDDKNTFIEKAREIHGDEYDYSNVEYVNCKTKIIITCKEHGDFEQMPISHISNKSGCKKCGIKKSQKSKTHTTNDFITKAELIHGNLYDYSSVNYKKRFEKVTIICKIHGKFEQRASDHLSGNGCYNCHIRKKYSKQQIEWLIFIQSKDNIVILHALNKGEFNIPNTRFKADGYCKETNTIYEFHGDYWHGNPSIYDPHEETYFGKTFRELYEKTLEREKQIKDMGFNLITIWESDWIKLNKCVKLLQQKFRNSKPH